MEYKLIKNDKIIRLSSEEVRKIYTFQEREYHLRDLEYKLREMGISSVEGIPEEYIVSFEKALSKCDDYYEAYWNCMESVILLGL